LTFFYSGSRFLAGHASHLEQPAYLCDQEYGSGHKEDSYKNTQAGQYLFNLRVNVFIHLPPFRPLGTALPAAPLFFAIGKIGVVFPVFSLCIFKRKKDLLLRLFWKLRFSGRFLMTGISVFAA